MIVDKNGMCTLSEEDCGYHSCNTKQTKPYEDISKIICRKLAEEICDFKSLNCPEYKPKDCVQTDCVDCWENFFIQLLNK